MFRFLDCFCGLGGASEGFAKEGFDCTGIEIEPKIAKLYPYRVMVADMGELKGEDFRGYDVIWASPPCECFSVASISKYWTGGIKAYIPKNEKTKSAVGLVKHTLNFIENAKPKFWIMENPRGMLRKVIGQPRGVLTFCQYGDTRMKITDIWGTIPESFVFRRCKNGDSCHERSSRGAKTGTQGLRDKYFRAKIPLGLSQAFASACKEELEK